jgi:cyclic beta-1,2-glucan synthetase
MDSAHPESVIGDDDISITPASGDREVEQMLRRDPAGCYEAMDETTKQAYLTELAKLAEFSTESPLRVAELALELAIKAEASQPQSHIGYYLLGAGRMGLERQLHVQIPFQVRLQRWCAPRRCGLYVATIAVTSAALAALCVSMQVSIRELPLWLPAVLVVQGMFAFVPIIASMLSIANGLRNKHARLPRMDFSRGIPDHHRTLIAIPALLDSHAKVDELCAALVSHHDNCRDDGNCFYALLTDFPDAAQRTLPHEPGVLSHLLDSIAALNRKFASGGARFFVLHRERVFNQPEGVWMGHERKRGKLADLFRYLSDASSAPFSTVSAAAEDLRGMKYVMTLDADTRLTPRAVSALVAVMTHPLNQATGGVMSDARRLTGYGILQPTLCAARPRGATSRYERMGCDAQGYVENVHRKSDLSQDLFDEGSFYGKGLCDVFAFRDRFADRLPENLILSHDLLEGCLARTATVSDVALTEECPTSYLSDITRRHRWIRGDWQNLLWCLKTLFAPTTLPRLSSLLARWKVLENVIRDCSPLAVLGLLFSGWAWLPNKALWAACIVCVLLLPTLLILGIDWFVFFRQGGRRSPSLRSALWRQIRTCLDKCCGAALGLSTLYFDAYVAADAIVRSSWRVFVTKQKILEWQPFGRVENPGAFHYVREMALPLLISLTFLACAVVWAGLETSIAALFGIAWISSPFVMWACGLAADKDVLPARANP